MQLKTLGLIAMAAVLAVCATLFTAHASEPGNEAKTEKVAVPKSVLDAVKAAFPKATVGATKRRLVTRAVYELAVVNGDQKSKVVVSEDGTLLLVEQRLSDKTVPAAIAAAFQKASGGARIGDMESLEVRGRLAFSALPKSEITYEAEFKREGAEYEVILDASGKVIRVEKDDDDDDDDGDHDDDDDDDDDDEEDDD